jgi:mRNA-degrading endonuclease toxin of MazEF toxin-antitoxin module
MIIKRGFIYLAAQDPVVGNEIAKTRPVIEAIEKVLKIHLEL